MGANVGRRLDPTYSIECLRDDNDETEDERPSELVVSGVGCSFSLVDVDRDTIDIARLRLAFSFADKGGSGVWPCRRECELGRSLMLRFLRSEELRLIPADDLAEETPAGKEGMTKGVSSLVVATDGGLLCPE